MADVAETRKADEGISFAENDVNEVSVVIQSEWESRGDVNKVPQLKEKAEAISTVITPYDDKAPTRTSKPKLKPPPSSSHLRPEELEILRKMTPGTHRSTLYKQARSRISFKRREENEAAYAAWLKSALLRPVAKYVERRASSVEELAKFYEDPPNCPRSTGSTAASRAARLPLMPIDANRRARLEELNGGYYKRAEMEEKKTETMRRRKRKEELVVKIEKDKARKRAYEKWLNSHPLRTTTGGYGQSLDSTSAHGTVFAALWKEMKCLMPTALAVSARRDDSSDSYDGRPPFSVGGSDRYTEGTEEGLNHQAQTIEVKRREKLTELSRPEKMILSVPLSVSQVDMEKAVPELMKVHPLLYAETAQHNTTPEESLLLAAALTRARHKNRLVARIRDVRNVISSGEALESKFARALENKNWWSALVTDSEAPPESSL